MWLKIMIHVCHQKVNKLSKTTLVRRSQSHRRSLVLPLKISTFNKQEDTGRFASRLYVLMLPTGLNRTQTPISYATQISNLHQKILTSRKIKLLIFKLYKTSVLNVVTTGWGRDKISAGHRLNNNNYY